jgi:hypothetical protein
MLVCHTKHDVAHLGLDLNTYPHTTGSRRSDTHHWCKDRLYVRETYSYGRSMKVS